MRTFVTIQPLAAMSIDVEDWFQVENLKSAIARQMMFGTR